jgi:hypothetical protein
VNSDNSFLFEASQAPQDAPSVHQELLMLAIVPQQCEPTDYVTLCTFVSSAIGSSDVIIRGRILLNQV